MKPLSERDENQGIFWFQAYVDSIHVGMKPLSERDENFLKTASVRRRFMQVGMKPLSERDENHCFQLQLLSCQIVNVGMKPLSERDENNK